jgi:hypothetical protein
MGKCLGSERMARQWRHEHGERRRQSGVELLSSINGVETISSENATSEMWQPSTDSGPTHVNSVFVLKSTTAAKWRMANSVVKQRHPLLRILMLKWPREWLRGERKLVSLGTKILRAKPSFPEGVEPARLSEISHIDIGRRYRLSGTAGRGAFASVLAAKDLKTGELVAIKRVGDAAPDDFAVRRLLRELYQLRKVSTPLLPQSPLLPSLPCAFSLPRGDMLPPRLMHGQVERLGVTVVGAESAAGAREHRIDLEPGGEDARRA